MPWQEVATDWYGEAVLPPVQFSFQLGARDLSFHARRRHPASCHPDARQGRFQAGLWQYDVAEFFLLDPGSGHYLEVNLAPNGAYWCCEFSAPRRQVGECRDCEARARGSCHDAGWEASLTMPRGWLEARFHLGTTSRLNATFILDSPTPRYLSAAPLPGAQPDFHQPDAFPPVLLA